MKPLEDRCWEPSTTSNYNSPLILSLEEGATVVVTCKKNQKAPNHIIFRCYSTAETATKITRLGIHKTREAVVLPKARLFILLPVLGLNVIETVSISRTPMLSEQDKLDFRIWPCKQESGIQSRTQNSMLKTNLPINTGYREKKMRTGTGFSRNFTAALWNIKGSYTDFSYAFD